MAPDPSDTPSANATSQTAFAQQPGHGEFFRALPRPHAVAAQSYNKLWTEVVDGYFARHRVKPGVTGWAQVNQGHVAEVEDLLRLRRCGHRGLRLLRMDQAGCPADRDGKRRVDGNGNHAAGRIIPENSRDALGRRDRSVSASSP